MARDLAAGRFRRSGDVRREIQASPTVVSTAPQLQADTAYFFDDNTRIELENVNTTFFTSTGAKDAVLTSRRGTNNNRTGTMVARRNVVVVSEDGRRLTTPELIYNQQRNEISSDSAFVMTEPNRRLEGIGFRSDPNMNNIQILKGASGFAKGVTTQPTAAPDATSADACPAARRSQTLKVVKLAISLACRSLWLPRRSAQDIPSSCDLEFPTGTNTVANDHRPTPPGNR